MTEISTVNNSFILMCKDIPVYNASRNLILNRALLPGALKCGTLSFKSWMKTRYSAGSNVTARRLMLRSHGTDNHNKVLKTTRALSLSDCFWLKTELEDVKFKDITPYLNNEWNGTGEFTGGSISTLFVNGAADKQWVDSATLVKFNSTKEFEPFELCKALGLANFASKVELQNSNLCVTNFTGTDIAFESMEQSGFIDENDDARSTAVDLFGWRAVALFIIDYLVEHDDRHWGNFGFLRNTNTGEYLDMAPYFDFDWAWSGESVPLPENAVSQYKTKIIKLCEKAGIVSSGMLHGGTILKRAEELIRNI